MTTSVGAEPVIVVGAGGLGSELAEYLADCSREMAGFLDDAATGSGAGRVLGPIRDHAPRGDALYLIGVGDPALRRRFATLLADRGARFATLIHPLSSVARSARVGAGTALAPFSYVGPNARVGEHVLLNTHASVGHDSRAGPYSVLSPYSALNGNVSIADEVFLGTQAAVLPGCRVGARSKIAAGAALYRDAGEGCLVAGNPAKARRLYGDPEPQE